MEKKTNILHLRYCIAICLLLLLGIIICWVLTSKNVVSEEAFENFAFASTIVSIVLAVVSIVYTIHSGAGMVNSIEVLKNVEDNISSQIETLQGVEKVIKDSINEEKLQMEASLKGMLKSQFDQFFMPPSSEFLRVERYNGGTFSVIDIHSNPPLGNIFLYCCWLSKATNKPWDLNMPQDGSVIYFYGYMAALKAIPSTEFSYHLDKNNNMLSECEFSKTITDNITIEQLQEVLNEQSKEYPMFSDVMLRINIFFGVK